jgi:hypothetical protein
MTGIELISEERKRQIHFEGFDKSHDLKHGEDELALAGAVYAIPADKRHAGALSVTRTYWPFESYMFKPDETGTIEGRIKELSKAGALIAAEIDRLQELKKIIKS